MKTKKEAPKLKFKKNPDLSSDDFWYDLSDGGYLTAEDFSDDKATIATINDAIKLISTLQERVDAAMEARDFG